MNSEMDKESGGSNGSCGTHCGLVKTIVSNTPDAGPQKL